MITFHSSVDRVLDPGCSALEWAETMADALRAGFFQNTWRIDAGSSRRVVFSWEGGARLTWIGDEDGDPVLVQFWHADGSAGDEPVGAAFWEWDAQTGAWAGEVPSVVDLVRLVESLVGVYGPISGLTLPWEPFQSDEFVEEILCHLEDGDSFEDKLAAADADGLGEALDSLLDEFDDHQDVTGLLLLVSAVAGGVGVPSVWGAAMADVTDGADMMPPASPNVRFMEFIRLVEELDGWVVVWDECCASCFRGSYEMMLQSSGLPEGSPSVALFAQNSQYYFPPDGTVSYELYQADEGQCLVLAEKAAQAGLACRVQDGSVFLG